MWSTQKKGAFLRINKATFVPDAAAVDHSQGIFKLIPQDELVPFLTHSLTALVEQYSVGDDRIRFHYMHINSKTWNKNWCLLHGVCRVLLQEETTGNASTFGLHSPSSTQNIWKHLIKHCKDRARIASGTLFQMGCKMVVRRESFSLQDIGISSNFLQLGNVKDIELQERKVPAI